MGVSVMTLLKYCALFSFFVISSLSSARLAMAEDALVAYHCYGFSEARGYPVSEADGGFYDELSIVLSPKTVLRGTDGSAYAYKPQLGDADHAAFFSAEANESIDFEAALARNGELQSRPTARTVGYIRIQNFGPKKWERKFKCFKKEI